MKSVAIGAAFAIALVACKSPAPSPAPAPSQAAAALAPAPAPTPASAPSSAPAAALSARIVDKGICGEISLGGGFKGNFLAARDLTTSFVDGDDLLAIVNRSPTGTLAADYAPSDMVQLFTMKPVTARDCETRTGPCLRREAAEALHKMLEAMRSKAMIGRIESAYRGYQGQCGTFVHWAQKETSEFCSAVEQSALAGHSQHQLGTTVDLFTEDWAEEGKKSGDGTFRSGFGCTRAGIWLDEHAWEFGYVLPYPIHVDDRHPEQRCSQRWDMPMPANPKTGYKNEPWHLRFIGVESAARFHEAWLASGPETPNEITLEQWLRARVGRVGDADLPVCDGCACDACATLAGGDGKAKPCREANVLWIDPASGAPAKADADPQIVDARVGAAKNGAQLVEVKLSIPPRTVTQPPILRADAPVYAEGMTFESLVPYRKRAPHAYPDLPGAWRVGVEPVPAANARWPWRAGIARDHLGRVYNRANLYLPAAPGEAWTRMTIALPPGATAIRVTLLRDGEEHGTRELPVQGAADGGVKRSE